MFYISGMNVLISHLSCVRSRINRNRYFCSGRWCCSNQRQEIAKVPPQPTWNTFDESLLPEPTAIDVELINHLERLSLVEFGNVEGIDRLKKAIRFADTLLAVDTSNVTPMANVLEDRALFLREDIVTEGNCRELLLKLARKTMEEYYVAPPGNIPINKLKRYDVLNTALKDDCR